MITYSISIILGESGLDRVVFEGSGSNVAVYEAGFVVRYQGVKEMALYYISF